MADTNAIPDGFHSITPYLTVNDVNGELDFLRRAFGATELYSMRTPDGAIHHAEYRIGNSIVMIGEARGNCEPARSSLYLYTEDADAFYERAIKAGGQSIQEVSDQFYGDRSGGVRDPAGNTWWIATHKEDVASEELERRAQAICAGQKAQTA